MIADPFGDLDGPFLGKSPGFQTVGERSDEQPAAIPRKQFQGNKPLAGAHRAVYDAVMDKVRQIEAEIAKLSPDEVRQVALWLAEHDATLWSRQIDADAEAGRLNFLFEEADAERTQGTLRDWPPAGG